MKLYEAAQYDRLLNQADRLMAAGNACGAYELASRVVHDEPGHVRGRVAEAVALLQMGREDEALVTLDAAEMYAGTIEANAETTGADVDDEMIRTRQLLRAEILGRMGRNDDAAEVLKGVLEIYGQDREAMAALATLELDMGLGEEAVKLLKGLVEMCPNDRQLCRDLAEAYEITGRTEKAILVYEEMGGCDVCWEETILVGDRAVMGLRRARLYRDAGRLCDAARVYGALIAGDASDDVQVACEAAAVAVEMGDDLCVMRYLENALSVSPGDRTAMRMLAEEHMRCGRFVQSGMAWWRLWRMDESDGDVLAGLIVCAMVAKRDRLADRMMAKLSEMLGIVERRRVLGRMWEEAVGGELLDDIIWRRQQPKSVEVLSRLLDETAGGIGQHIEEHSDRADMHYHLAMCYAGTDELESAAKSLDHALRINGGYVAAARMRVELLLGDKNYVAAGAVIESLRAVRSVDNELFDLDLAVRVLCGQSEEAVDELFGLSENVCDHEEVMVQVMECLLTHNEQAAKQWQAMCHRRQDEEMASDDEKLTAA